MDKKRHHILSLRKENSGSFEHAWNLAKNLKDASFDVKYFYHWWDSDPFELDLSNGNSKTFSIEELSKSKGVFHLQTHTWEYEGYFDKIFSNRDGKKLIYNLHAIIPYFYMDSSLKEPFLNGEISYSDLKSLVENKLSEREKAQLSLFNKVDYLFSISKNHKKVLDLMGVETPSYVFENVTDFENLSEEEKTISFEESKKVREDLETDNILLYCGRVESGKGNRNLFGAFEKILMEDPSAKMIMLGESRIEKILDFGLSEKYLSNLEIVPWVDKNFSNGRSDFLKYYFASDVLVQPMITDELYSKTVIDAMALGLPVISCKSPYTIGTSKNQDEIYDSFNFLKNNPEEVNKIISLAKEKVKRENTWDSYISRVEKLTG